MKRITQLLAMASVAGLCLSVGNLMAQDNGGPGGRPGRGNFDPARMQEFQQRMAERMMQATRDRLEITDDTEWNAIQPLVQKVMDARRDQMGGMGRGFMGRRNRGGDRPRFGPEPSAEETALSDAIENNASKEELQTKMAAFRKVKAAKEEELKKAQDSLKKVLTTKQEAVALEMGLVN